MMQIIPAIDIKNGKCVRLFKGDFAQTTEYDITPLEMAKQYIQEGATQIHIVDLDGAQKALFAQNSMISEIAEYGATKNVQVQVGGGIRTKEQLITLFEQGISRVVIGSMAVSEPDTVIVWLNTFGAEKIVLALDVNIDEQNRPRLATQGWQTQTQMSLWDLLDRYKNTPLKYVLCTDIGRDGAMVGPNIALYSLCQEKYPELAWQASGGVSALSDLVQLKNIAMYGAIIGKSLYEKKFTLPEALKSVATC